MDGYVQIGRAAGICCKSWQQKVLGNMWREQSRPFEGQLLYKTIEEGIVGSGWREKMGTE